MPQNRRPARQANPKRDARARAAEKHTQEMAAKWAKEIQKSLDGVRLFDGMPKARKAVKVAEEKPEKLEAQAEETVEEAAGEVVAVEEPAEAVEAEDAEDEEAPAEEAVSPEAVPACPVQVSVVNATTTQAVLDNGRGYAQFCDLAVLDFASFTNPGGGYIRGGLAQEEAICADSFLYNVLKEQGKFYNENRRRNINCELYRNRALVVPAVRFERNKVHAYGDVIVAAAPNARRAKADYKVKDEALERAMRDRIRFVLAICDELGHEKAIFGAYGCGVFGWDAETVATMFLEELAEGDHVLKQVVFAVPQSNWDENLPMFEHVLGNFPNKPEGSYAQAKAAKAAEAAANEAAAEEDDEDEDDWRKYL